MGHGKYVVLRVMRTEDMEMIANMFNDPAIESLVEGWAFPLSLEQQMRWFERHMDDTTSFRFTIDKPDDGAVGIVTLTDIDWKAQHGIKLCAPARGKGIGTDTVMAIGRYAFDEIGLHQLDGGWFENNHASKRLYQKCGWQEEGRIREAIYKSGVWHDWICAGILEKDYRRVVKELHFGDK